MGTVIVLVIIAAVAGLAFRGRRNDKKNGKGCCNGNCSSCGGCKK